MADTSHGKPLYSLHDLARLLGYHVRTISRMIDSGEIRAVRIRNRWMVKSEDFKAYIEEQQTNQR